MATKAQKLAALRRKHSLWNSIIHAVGPLVGLQQLISKDTADIEGETTTIGKLSRVVNVVVGRITGINPVPGHGSYPQTMNPAGMVNHYTIGGAALMLYGKIGPKILPGRILPFTGKAAQLGKQVFAGGAVGGFFDAPDKEQSKNIQTFNRQANKYGYNAALIAPNSY